MFSPFFFSSQLCTLSVFPMPPTIAQCLTLMSSLICTFCRAICLFVCLIFILEVVRNGHCQPWVLPLTNTKFSISVDCCACLFRYFSFFLFFLPLSVQCHFQPSPVPPSNIFSFSLSFFYFLSFVEEAVCLCHTLVYDSLSLPFPCYVCLRSHIRDTWRRAVCSKHLTKKLFVFIKVRH